VLGGSITSTGGYDANQHGFVYGNNSDFSSVVGTTTGGSFSGTGSFVASQAISLSSLVCGTTYYYRAYATNDVGTDYGSTSSFSTSACPVASGGGGGGGGGNGPIYGYRQINTTNLIAPTTTMTVSTSTQTPQPKFSQYTFSRNFSLHATGADVKKLQIYLNNSGFIISSFGAGSKGKETSYFGNKTMIALKKYQKFYNIISTGYFGPITRSQINKMISR
jgi:hypothetical protein